MPAGQRKTVYTDSVTNNIPAPMRKAISRNCTLPLPMPMSANTCRLCWKGYANGADPLAGGSAAVAAERAAEYLAKQYDDGRTAIDPISGKFNPNLLPEHIKEEIKAQTGALASVVGAAGGSLNGTSGTNTNALFNAQVGGVLGQNAVENNYLTREKLNAQVDAAVACRKGDKAA